MAYLMHTQEGQVSNAFEEFGLYVASLQGDVQVVQVGDCVAFGYDWSKDGRTNRWDEPGLERKLA